MIRVLLTSLRAVLVLTVLTGVIYPTAVTAFARVLFREQALGSRVRDRAGVLRGSRLIGQPFTRAEYFWGRPSASGYDGMASGGRNLSPVGSDAVTKARVERERLRAANPEARGEPPIELLSASASGLDPHISPAAALWQAARVARARGVDVGRVEALLAEDHFVAERTFGFLGEPRVNVLEINAELDKRFPLSR